MDTSTLKMGIMAVAIAAAFAACSAGTGSSDAGDAGDADAALDSDENVGSAVGSLFTGSEAPSLKVAVAAIKAIEEGPRSACDTIGDTDVSGVEMSPSITAGTYGKSDDSVTVEASDGCDQGGEYAGFAVVEHEMVCTDGDGHETTVVMQESSGIFRENLDLDRTEIYGTFSLLFTSDGSSETVSDLDCSLTIDRDQQFGGGCEDGDGESIEPSNDVTCVDNE